MKNAVWYLKAMSVFGEMLADALGWAKYPECPVGECDTVLIVGLYDAPDYALTLAHTARAKRRIFYFCGTDVQMLTQPELLPDATYLCETEGIQRELFAKGIEAKVCMFPTRLCLEANPLPEKPAVAFYAGNDPRKYGSHYVDILQEAMPDVDFYVYGIGVYTPEQMQELADKVSVYIRLTEHDGAAASAREFMQAGRRVIITADLPYAKQVTRNAPEGIVRAVRNALREKEPDWAASAFWRAANSTERFLADFKEATRG